MSDIYILILEQKWHDESAYVYKILNAYDSKEKAHYAMLVATNDELTRHNSSDVKPFDANSHIITYDKYTLRFYIETKPLL